MNSVERDPRVVERGTHRSQPLHARRTLLADHAVFIGQDMQPCPVGQLQQFARAQQERRIGGATEPLVA